MSPIPAITPVMNSLWSRAAAKDVSILGDPRVAFLRDRNEDTPLHILAATGSPEVLTHPKVASVPNKSGLTPLHVLASLGVGGVVDHPQVAAVFDVRGESPLHYLAYAGYAEALRHPEVGSVVDESGRTPLMELAQQGNEAAKAMLEEQKPASDKLYDDVPCLSPVATLVADIAVSKSAIFSGPTEPGTAPVPIRSHSPSFHDLTILSEMDDLDGEFGDRIFP